MQDPANYEKHKSVAASAITEFVPLLISKMSWNPLDGDILDFGCGAGTTAIKYFLPLAELHDLKILGVDISENMISFAKSNSSHQRISYQVKNILDDQDIPFQEGQVGFAHIFCILVFHFTKDYKEVLRRLKRMLTVGGHLAFLVLTKSEMFSALEHFAQSEKWGSYMKGLDKFIPEWVENEEFAEEAFRNALESENYKVLELSTHERLHVFPRNTLAELFMSLNPLIKGVPIDEIPALKMDCLEYISKTLESVQDKNSMGLRHEYLLGVVENQT